MYFSNCASLSNTFLFRPLFKILKIILDLLHAYHDSGVKEYARVDEALEEPEPDHHCYGEAEL